MDFPDKKNQAVIAPTKKRRGFWSTLAMLFLLLLALAIGTAGWFWYQWQNDHTSLLSQQTAVSTAESTITNLKNELTKANSQLKETTEKTANMTDDQLIEQAVKAEDKLHAVPMATIKVSVTKKDGNQAIAEVGDGTKSAYNAYLKKADNQWQVVWTGQGTPTAEVQKLYGLTL